MSIKVRNIESKDIAQTAHLIRIAFETGAFHQWLSGPNPNHEYLESIFKIRINASLDDKHVMQVATLEDQDDTVVGFALWNKPIVAGTKDSWAEWFSQGLTNTRIYLISVYYQISKSRQNRRLYFKRRLQEVKQRLITDPEGYWDLNILCVDPQHQGKGVGKELLESIIPLADKQGLKCYLEASDLSTNVKVYEKQGFRIVENIELDFESENTTVSISMEVTGTI